MIVSMTGGMILVMLIFLMLKTERVLCGAETEKKLNLLKNQSYLANAI
jgi:hypothetical protein